MGCELRPTVKTCCSMRPQGKSNDNLHHCMKHNQHGSISEWLQTTMQSNYSADFKSEINK